MGKTVGDLGNLTFVLSIIVFIFAVMGMQLFGKNYTEEKYDQWFLCFLCSKFLFCSFGGREIPRWNFKDFMHSFMIVFRVLCGEWIESMWDCMRVSGPPCVPFFLATVVIGNLVVLNLFLALLLASFGASNLSAPTSDSADTKKLQEAFDRFSRGSKWIKNKVMQCLKVNLSTHKCFLLTSFLFVSVFKLFRSKTRNQIGDQANDHFHRHSNDEKLTDAELMSMTTGLRPEMMFGQGENVDENGNKGTPNNICTKLNNELELMLMKAPLKVCNSNGSSGGTGNNVIITNQNGIPNLAQMMMNHAHQKGHNHHSPPESLHQEAYVDKDHNFNSTDSLNHQEESPVRGQFGRSLTVDSTLIQATEEKAISPSSFQEDSHGIMMSGTMNGSTSKLGTGDDDKIDTITADVIISEYPKECFPEHLYKYCPCCLQDTPFWAKWKEIRLQCYQTVENKYFETVVIILILISSMALVCFLKLRRLFFTFKCFVQALEDVNFKKDALFMEYLGYMDKFFTVIFFFEMLVKWLAFGFAAYFTNAWCWLDFVIVMVSSQVMG